jgi:hypothetical protein
MPDLGRESSSKGGGTGASHGAILLNNTSLPGFSTRYKGLEMKKREDLSRKGAESDVLQGDFINVNGTSGV